MIIGVDFDGVIAETALLKMDYVKNYFHKKISINNSSKIQLTKIIGLKEYSSMIKKIYSDECMYQIPAVKESVIALKQLRLNNKLIIITSRNKKEADIAKIWLKKQRIIYDKFIYTSNRNKSLVCQKNSVDIIIEDDLDKLTKIKSNTIKKILLIKPYNQNRKTSRNIIKCYSWSDIVKSLE